MAGGAAILVVIVLRLGFGPFLDGLRHATWPLIVAGLLTTAVSTGCSAWRWHLVAAGLGVDVPRGMAVAAYYRSQFLNLTLPGGVVGDVHRGLAHGHQIGDVARGLRAVAWERSLGQGVQVLLALAVLFALPSPVRRAMVVGLCAIAVVGLAVILLVVAAGPRLLPRSRRWLRLRGALIGDLRRIIVVRRAGPAIVALSCAAFACHATLLVLAAQATGETPPIRVLLPIALFVLVASAVPTNVAGWGPREGVAAWAFGMIGLTPEHGVSAAVLLGVLATIGTLPGAALIFAGRMRRRTPAGAVRPIGARPGPGDEDG